MNRNKTVSDARLRETFKEMPMENLPSGFMERLTPKIEKAAVSKQKEKTLTMYLQIAAGILSIFFFLILTFNLCNLFIPGFSFSLSSITVKFDSNIIIIGLAVTMLLIIDSLRILKTKNGD
jgi:flagellar biosynthesis protein FlhB